MHTCIQPTQLGFAFGISVVVDVQQLAAKRPVLVEQFGIRFESEARLRGDAQDGRAAKPIWPALIEGPIWIDKPVDGTPMPKDAEYVMWAN